MSVADMPRGSVKTIGRDSDEDVGGQAFGPERTQQVRSGAVAEVCNEAARDPQGEVTLHSKRGYAAEESHPVG